jgi:plastocyanin
MRVRAAAVTVVMVVFLALGWSTPALAGGCGRPATHGAGTTLAISKMCFQPSLLEVEPGATVTFVNRDPIAHNINGQLWGHFDDLAPGARFEATFEQEGTYPFACTLHPGMTGAIVVGDGMGPGNGRSVTVRPVLLQAAAPAAPAAPVATSAASDGATEWTAVVLAALLGLVLGAGLTTYRSRAADKRLTRSTTR